MLVLNTDFKVEFPKVKSYSLSKFYTEIFMISDSLSSSYDFNLQIDIFVIRVLRNFV